jgi:hypothetical protein
MDEPVQIWVAEESPTLELHEYEDRMEEWSYGVKVRQFKKRIQSEEEA